MPTAPELPSYREDRRNAVGVCVFLTIAIWLVFGQTLNHGFVNFDDDRYVYENAEISKGLTIEGLRYFLTHSHAQLWHPLTTLTHMIDCQIYGLRPGGHHFSNVVIHNIASMLLFLALWQMSGFLWRSAFVAAVFAIHPMRVESVAWIAERKDLLSGVFFALTLAAYLYYARRPSFRRYAVLTIAVVCGLMSKATFVTVPLLLLLLDYWPLERWQRAGTKLQVCLPAVPAKPGRLLFEKLPLIALSLAASAATIYAQTQTIASLEQLSLLPRIKNAAVSIIIYLRQIVWPSDLAVFYPHPRDHLNTWIVLGSIALILAITLIALLSIRKRPWLFVGWFWFLILLFPVLGFFQSGLQARADRFTYLPHIGITIAVTWTIADLIPKWRYRRAVLAAVAICIVVVFTICSWKQTTYWQDSASVWRRDLAVTSDNQVGRQNLAAALWARGDVAEARIESRTANIIHSEAMVKDFPLNITARDDLGVLLLQAGDIRGAIAQWQTSLQIDSHDGNALNNLAWVLATYPDDSIRNGSRAVQFAQSATQLPGGDTPIVQRTLAAAYAESGDFEKAIQIAQHAAELAQSQGNNSLVETLRHETGMYQSHTAYREKPPE